MKEMDLLQSLLPNGQLMALEGDRECCPQCFIHLPIRNQVQLIELCNLRAVPRRQYRYQTAKFLSVLDVINLWSLELSRRLVYTMENNSGAAAIFSAVAVCGNTTRLSCNDR